MNIIKIVKELRKAHKVAEEQGYLDKDKWKKDMYENRFRNLFLSMIFVGGAACFFIFPFFIKSGFATPIHRYVMIGVAGFLLIVGLFTLINYIVLIIRRRKD